MSSKRIGGLANRLSGFGFFAYTLAFCGFMVGVIIVFILVGGSGDRTGLLLGLGLLSLYLHYIVRARLKT